MELSKETLWSVPLRRLRQTYILLSEELPKMMDDAYLDIIEQLYGVLGENAIVTATNWEGISTTIIQVTSSPDHLCPLAAILKEASEVRGFGISFKAETALPSLEYRLTLNHLPAELDWIWNTVSTTPVTLKTVIKKLKK
jgi:hypothetical protein